MHKISDIRRDYHKHSLSRQNLHDDPIEQFKIWLEYAISAESDDPTAMTLSTVNAVGSPSSRIVLLKDVNEEGFTFFTNYSSDKGRHIDFNPSVAINFFWPTLEQQVRIEGMAQKTSSAISDSYFQSRPRESQMGATISPQSEVIDDDFLEKQLTKLSGKLEGSPIPRPKNWGGYLVKPSSIEFWQGRANRLHDRYRYTKHKTNWLLERLAP